MSGWIVPLKDSKTKYPLTSKTFYITTEGATGTDRIDIYLFDDSSGYITNIWWTFNYWIYSIAYCTSSQHAKMFPVTPPLPAGDKKTWEVTVTPDDIRIKGNNMEVLHFIFNNADDEICKSSVGGKTTSKIMVWSTDTATKMLATELIGKY